MNILSNILSFLILTCINNRLLKKRFYDKRIDIIVFILTIIILTLINGFTISILSTLTITISYALYTFVIYTGSLKKVLIILFSFMMINAVSEIFSANIMNWLLNINSISDMYTYQYVFAILLANLISFLFSLLFMKIMQFTHWKYLPKFSYLLIVLPITTLLLILNLNNYFSLFKDNYFLIFIFLGLIFSNLVTIFVFVKVLEYIQIEKELIKVKAEKNVSDIRYTVLNTLYNSNFNFIHDTIRKLFKLENLLTDELNNDFKRELLSINNYMLKELNIINSNSTLIGSILNYKLDEIIESNIDFKSVIEYNDFSFLDVYDQRQIFSILLELGIKHCTFTNKLEKNLILKTKELDTHIVIQLLMTHSDFHKTTEFTQGYKTLKNIVTSYSGDISFQESYSEDVDSLVIVFSIL